MFFLDVLKDSLLDTLKMLPFLLIAFFLLEFLEHRAGEKTVALLRRSGKAGPAAGAVLGLLPQCGFSIMGANFFADHAISMGTLIAVFLSTSDEAIIILLAEPKRAKDVLLLLGVKFLIALIGGYAVDALYHRREEHNPRICHEEHCHDGCGCSCNSEESFLKNVLKRTASVWIFLFLASLALGFAIELLGEETLRHFLLTDSVFQPFLTGLVGLIPNCAPSAILAQMYLEGTVGFGAVVSGLCSAAGMGMLVLFRTNKNMKENFTVLGLTYGIGVFSGVILSLIFR